MPHSKPENGCPRGASSGSKRGQESELAPKMKTWAWRRKDRTAVLEGSRCRRRWEGLVGGHRKEGLALNAEANLQVTGEELAGVKRIRKTLKAGQA
jgi:hypothetical protein